MKRCFNVGDIVVRNSRGLHKRIKEGTRWRVVKTFGDESYRRKIIIVRGISEDGKSTSGDYMAPAIYFNLSTQNYYNTSKHGKNYRAKVAQ